MNCIQSFSNFENLRKSEYNSLTKKSCYMKQQSHSFESTRQAHASWRQLPQLNDAGHDIDAWKTFKIHVNICKTVQLLQDFFSAMVANWRKLKTLIWCCRLLCVSNRSALVCELMSNNSLFVGQLYKIKQTGAARSWFDLLYNWPPNSELLLNNSLL